MFLTTCIIIPARSYLVNAFLNFSRIICTNFRQDHASGFWGAGLCGWNCCHTFFAVFPQLFSSTRCVRRKIVQNKKFNALSYVELFGGRGWIRTTEAESSRFTVCPHWPLGNTPIFFCVRRADCLYILPRAKQFVNHLQQILSQFLHQSLQQTRPMEKPPGNQCSRAVFLGAGDRS